MSKNSLRQEAYHYIMEKLSALPMRSRNVNLPPAISLSELMLLKDGSADPSEELVALIKQLLMGITTEAEIEAHLVTPFKSRN